MSDKEMLNTNELNEVTGGFDDYEEEQLPEPIVMKCPLCGHDMRIVMVMVNTKRVRMGLFRCESCGVEVKHPV